MMKRMHAQAVDTKKHLCRLHTDRLDAISKVKNHNKQVNDLLRCPAPIFNSLTPGTSEASLGTKDISMI